MQNLTWLDSRKVDFFVSIGCSVISMLIRRYVRDDDLRENLLELKAKICELPKLFHT